MTVKVFHYAGELVEAKRKREKISPLTKRNKKLTLHDAYLIQEKIAADEQAMGKKIIGKNIGIVKQNNDAKQKEQEMQYVGRLFNDMVLERTEPLHIQHRENMQIGVSIAFKLKETIACTKMTYLDVLMATDYVVPALGIYESHWSERDISLIDIVAENGAVTNIIFGKKKRYLHEVNFQSSSLNIYKNGELMMATAYSSHLGHPANAIAKAAEQTVFKDTTFNEGELIVTSYTPTLIGVCKDDRLYIDFHKLGTISLTFV